jgi:hypothetical protein
MNIRSCNRIASLFISLSLFIGAISPPTLADNEREISVAESTDPELERRFTDESREFYLRQTQALQQAFSLRKELAALAKNLSPEEIVEQGVSIVRDGVGKAEFKWLEKQLIVRVVVESNRSAYFFVPAEIVHRDSPQLRTLVAINHLDSGRDEHTHKSGRDTFVVAEETLASGETVTEDIEYSRRHPFLSKTGFQEWSRATVTRPTLSDVTLAAASTAAQLAITSGISGGKVLIDGTPFDWAPIVVSAVYGMVIGTNINTYKKWTYRGSPFVQQIKNQAVSISNALAIVAISQAEVTSLTLFSVPWILQILSHAAKSLPKILINTTIGSFGKSSLNNIPRIREALRGKDETIDIPWLNSQWGRSKVEFQLVSLFTQALRVPDLIDVGERFSVSLPFTDYQLTPSKILLLITAPLTIPFMAWMTKRYEAQIALDPDMPATRKDDILKISREFQRKYREYYIDSIKAIGDLILSPVRLLIGQRDSLLRTNRLIKALQSAPKLACTRTCKLANKLLSSMRRGPVSGNITLEEYVRLPLSQLKADRNAPTVLAGFLKVFDALEQENQLRFPEYREAIRKKLDRLQSMRSNLCEQPLFK